MSKMRRILAMLLAVSTLLCLCACGKEETPAATTPPSATGEAGTYSVTVKNAAGQPMEGVTVYVYSEETLSNIVSYGSTDATGLVTLELPAGDHYIALSTVPKGYATETYYRFNGTSAEIVLTSSLVTGEEVSGVTLGVGDIMYDFTITKPDGTEVTLSKVLQEKKVAVLNFWYTTCQYCVEEFPLMQAAYEQFSDSVAIIAMDPTDTNQQVAAFQANMGLTFDMAACPVYWANVFGIQGYPTTVVVDRYGRICLVESGAILNGRVWTTMFEHFTAENYEQKLLVSGAELLEKVKPDVTLPTKEEMDAVLNAGGLNVEYRADKDEYAWPFIITEKDGVKCIKSPNKELDDSYAIVYFDVTLKAGQALGFDYQVSSESTADFLHVIVNGEAIYSISGANEVAEWKSCYPVVADQDGTYEVALCYIKDSDGSAGEDTAYVKNLRLANVSEINTPTYIPRKAGVSTDGINYNYVTIVYNEADGYYHVGEANGPLLLVDLMDYTDFSQDKTIWEMVYEGKFETAIAERLTEYANYASNGNLGTICTVNQELYELLQEVDRVCGFFPEDTQEWLRACKYFQAYGTNGEQLEDPIKGLTPFSAYTAVFGNGVETNFFYYNRILIPRGMLAEFIPEQSGVYRVTSRTDSTNGVEGWIFDENRNLLFTYERDERMFEDGDDEVSMVYYMEAGKAYYIDLAFWDPYEVGTIYYDIEYMGESVDHFRLCSHGYFTYDTDATGNAMYDVVAGGIDVVLGEDGYYHHDLGDGVKGSLIYADFVGLTSVFGSPIATVGDVQGLIDKGAFDFAKDENDQFVLSALATCNGDKEATKDYLKSQWGDDYEANYKEYKVDDVFDGIYHGKGKDYTEAIKAYLPKMINDGQPEREGCVLVDQQLAEILQMLMDKFTFSDVKNSWLKLCYYYDHLGPK